jgi:hypothetical protein
MIALRFCSFTCFVVFASQCAAVGATPKIKKMDSQKREAIRVALQADVAKGGEALLPWFNVVCICAPQLWAKISPSVDKKGIEIIPSHFTNPSEPGSTDGATFKGAEANRRLARSVAPLLAKGTVRLPTEDEWKKYWRIYPFDQIEEPVLVVSSAKGDILVHLLWGKENQRYFVFLLEALRSR